MLWRAVATLRSYFHQYGLYIAEPSLPEETLKHPDQPWNMSDLGMSHDLIELQQCTHISSNPEPCLNRMGHTCRVRINIACRLLNPNVI